ncbi:MAG: ribosome biogenesis GTPase Der [Chitinispirillaceae bacterium]|nr:ribosome biogenesis GTPase Der [Chitinispirillaceae bacterium]
MSFKPVVSIIGRPNVGKSSLFNRIIGKRLAVVDDQAGVTRDRNYYTTDWCGENLILVDTGGMLPADHTSIPEAIHEQVRIAVNESAVVLFLVDVTTGVTDVDLQIARIIRKIAPEKVICVVNKAESDQRLFEIGEFRALGLGDVYPVSALHGNGVAEVLDRSVALIRIARENETSADPVGGDAELRLAVVGRPNAGKSSLVNRLLHSSRMIVDDVPGTTRDSIDSPLVWNGRRVILIDTAGLRKKSHVKIDMEYYANLRALESIERCDICILMVDVTTGLGVQDLRILRKILEQHKGVLLVWNKWDSKSGKDHKTFDQLVAASRRQYKELQFIPMVSASALTGQRTAVIIEHAFAIHERMGFKVGAAEFEDNVFSWTRVHPHPAIPEKPVRFLGAKQVKAPFPLFRIFTSNPKGIVPAYHRYLINKIYETYNFEGCPVVVDYRPGRRAVRKRWSGDAQSPPDGGESP